MIYDTAIIGAGPAGSTFARQLALATGERILLLNGQSEANKKPCGGLLSPDAQKALAHFDLVLPKSVLADPQIFAVKTIDLGTGDVRYYQRYYLNMDRFAFDGWLLSLVPDTVDVLCGRCVGVVRESGGFALDISAQGCAQTLHCRRLVGADGASSIVRKSLFKNDIMKYTAIQQWFKSESGSTPFYSCVFDRETSESCSWLMYKDEYVIFGGCFAPNGSREAFEKQKKRLEDFLGHSLGKPEKTEACMACRPRKCADLITGKNGAYLIGEAAGLISASSFEGISSAITSGSLLARAVSAGGGERAIARRYRTKTLCLRAKLMLKTRKRWFMYTPWVRRLIMKAGIASIAVQHTR